MTTTVNDNINTQAAYRFSPQLTISAVDLAALLVATGALTQVSEEFVASLPFDAARHFKPVQALSGVDQSQLKLDV